MTRCLSVSPQGHNIFANLSSTEYSDLMQLLKQSILATDLTLYFECVPRNATRLIIKTLHLHTEPSDYSLITYLLPRRCLWSNTSPLWMLQEQELVLRVGQQRRVQLERQGSQRHVQVRCAHNLNKKFFLGSEITGNSTFQLRSMMMTACDLGAVTKPWEISRKVL